MRPDRLQSCAISVLVVVVISSQLAFAQSSGNASLDVVVHDPSGALVNKAQVQLLSNGRQEAAAQTNQNGEARFNKLVPGLYLVQVEAAGFKPQNTEAITLTPGSNRTEIALEIEVIKADVEVAEETAVRNTNPNGPAFSNVLTAEQIAQLPDDPDEFENAINQLAGPGAQIRVNGFRGGKLPPKSQIREIRFRLNPYAAENHDAGFGLVDITTKPGVNSWHGSFNFATNHLTDDKPLQRLEGRSSSDVLDFPWTVRSGRTIRHYFSTLMALFFSTLKRSSHNYHPAISLTSLIVHQDD